MFHGLNILFLSAMTLGSIIVHFDEFIVLLFTFCAIFFETGQLWMQSECISTLHNFDMIVLFESFVGYAVLQYLVTCCCLLLYKNVKIACQQTKMLQK